MSLNLDGNCQTDSCKQTLYQSADTTLNFELKTCQGKAYNILAASEIWALFPNATGGPLIKKLSLAEITITNGGAGMFSTNITAAEAALLATGLIDIEVRVTIGGKVTVAEILQALTVVPSLFPSA